MRAVFPVDEKGHDANLTDKGCETLNPQDPEHFVMPDLATALSELDGQTDLSAEEKIARRQKLQDDFAKRSERIHAVNQLIRAHCEAHDRFLIDYWDIETHGMDGTYYPNANDDGGCGCRAAAGSGTSAWAALALLLAVGTILRRRLPILG